jgi:hypothetical protein
MILAGLLAAPLSAQGEVDLAKIRNAESRVREKFPHSEFRIPH